MYVVKRDGRREPVAFEKVAERLRKVADGLHVNVSQIAQKVLAQIVDGIKTSELDVLSTKFRWRDAGLDWEWRPEGDYQNNSDTTIIYFEVAYILTSQDLFTSLSFREQIETELAPGKKTKIMASKWFPLSVLDSTANSLGYSLSYGAGATFRSEVRYIVFEDGTTAGSPT